MRSKMRLPVCRLGAAFGWLLIAAAAANFACLAQQSDAGPFNWPCFLGPNGDGKSPEKGILTDWPEAGPPVVWTRILGISYGIGSVSRGRYYQFDRHGDQARLSCLDARSGKFLWKFEYPTDYVDHYGYNNGPRCSPVVGGRRRVLRPPASTAGVISTLSLCQAAPELCNSTLRLRSWPSVATIGEAQAMVTWGRLAVTGWCGARPGGRRSRK